MRTETLQYFIVTADCKSMTSASDMLYISQQSISREIKNLENELGITLFLRSKNGVELTVDGQKAYDSAKKLLKQYYAFCSQFKESASFQIQTYSIAYYWGIQKLIAENLTLFNSLYPNISFNEYVFGSDRLDKVLLDGATDLVITQLLKDDFDILNDHIYKHIVLHKEPLRVAVCQSLVTPDLSFFDLNDLVNYPISFYIDQIGSFPLYHKIASQFGWAKIISEGNNIEELWKKSLENHAVLLLVDSMQSIIPYKDEFILLPTKQAIDIYTVLFFKPALETSFDVTRFQMFFHLALDKQTK